MSAQVGKALVSSDQPAPLILNARPQNIVGRSLPALLRYRRRVVSPSDQQVGNLTRQILVHLHPARSVPPVQKGDEVGVVYRLSGEFPARP